MLGEAVRELRGCTRGEVLEPTDVGYEAAREVYNAMAIGRPAIVFRPADLPDIVAAVRWAAGSGLAIGVRGGGHSVAGHSSRTERSSSTCRGGAERPSTRLQERSTPSPAVG
jgi:hypothetical protein